MWLLPAAALATAVITLWIIPATLDTGLQLAFAPRPLPDSLADTGRRMGLLHAAYAAVDLVKVACLLLAAWGLARSNHEVPSREAGGAIQAG